DGSAALISATTEMDDLTRAARQSAEELEQALTQRASAQALREEEELRAHALEETIEGLRERDAYKQGEELDRLRRRTEQAAAVAGRHRAHAQVTQVSAEEDQKYADEAVGQARTLDEHAREAAEETRRSARAAGMESIHHEVRTLLKADSAITLADSPGHGAGGHRTEDSAGTRTAGENGARQARMLLRGAVTARRRQVALITEAREEHDRAVRDRGGAESLLEEARIRLAEAIARRDEASDAWDGALAAQAERLLAWADDCTELRIADAGGLAARAQTEDEVTALVEAAARPLEQEIATAEATTRAARLTLRDERSRLEEEVRRLSGETDLPPTPTPTRTTVRTATAGAPLWRLVAFREGLPLPVQAAVEAALEASGLLDAWVNPYDGITLEGHDTRAEAALAVTASGPSLLEVLKPEEDIPVPVDTVTRILAGVAYGTSLPGDHPAAVSADGAWRLALATGTWSKPEPAYIGALARQRARQRKIGELTERIGEMNASLATLDDQLRCLGARRARLDADRAARPDHRELDAHRRHWDRAEEKVAARDDAVRDAAAHVAHCETKVAGALRALSRRAAEHGLPTDRDRLDGLSTDIDRFRDTADSWVDARLTATAAADRARQLTAQADRSRRAAEEQSEDAAAAEAEAAGLKARLE
ncbi:TIGR02680 family protein, partial [Streptomyces sp. NPDC057539]